MSDASTRCSVPNTPIGMPVPLRQLILDNLYKPNYRKNGTSEIRPEHIRRDSESCKRYSKVSVAEELQTAAQHIHSRITLTGL